MDKNCPNAPRFKVDIETLRRRVWARGYHRLLGDFRCTTKQSRRTFYERSWNYGSIHSLVSGHLRSLGLRVQRDRIRDSIGRVDPKNCRIAGP